MQSSRRLDEMLPDIPTVPKELVDPVSALVDAASIMRVVLTRVTEDFMATPESPLPSVMRKNATELKMAEKVIEAWRTHLQLDG